MHHNFFDSLSRGLHGLDLLGLSYPGLDLLGPSYPGLDLLGLSYPDLDLLGLSYHDLDLLGLYSSGWSYVLDMHAAIWRGLPCYRRRKAREKKSAIILST